MRNALMLVIALLAAGCTDPATMLKEQQPQQSAAPAEVPQAAETPDATTPADSAQPTDPSTALETAPQPPPRKSIIGQTTDKVVHLQEFHAQHPELVVAENKFTGTDPLTAALEGYVHLSAKASTLGMKQALQNHKILNERPPTYKEFLQMMRENRFELAELPANRIYAYDSENGTVVVLEEKAE